MDYNKYIQDWKKQDFVPLFKFINEKLGTKIRWRCSVDGSGYQACCHFNGFIPMTKPRRYTNIGIIHLLVHELAHWILHWRLGKKGYVKYPRWRQEREAELTAIKVTGYDGDWNNGKDWLPKLIDHRYCNPRTAVLTPELLGYIDKNVERAYKKIKKVLDAFFKGEKI